MAREIIRATRLTRHFTVAEGRKGFLGAALNLFSRKYRIKKAVEEIDLSIAAGEFVGYVGENGAGKSTTIKMLTGILHPTSGEAVVNGVVPYENRRENAYNIGVVFGQRTQLWWDLPVRESFDLLRTIFRVPDELFARNMTELSEALTLEPLMTVPVRKLSLGQRMRCDLAAALLHSPKILFLDEPTIGLDIIAKDHVRRFLKKINRERGTTIILTTHDMEDIERLCERIIILDEGRIVYDGATDTLKREYIKEKILEVECYEGACSFTAPGVTILRQEANTTWLSFRKDEVSVQEVIGDILKANNVKDIAIHEPKVEDIVKRIYADADEIRVRSVEGAVP